MAIRHVCPCYNSPNSSVEILLQVCYADGVSSCSNFKSWWDCLSSRGQAFEYHPKDILCKAGTWDQSKALNFVCWYWSAHNHTREVTSWSSFRLKIIHRGIICLQQGSNMVKWDQKSLILNWITPSKAPSGGRTGNVNTNWPVSS